MEAKPSYFWAGVLTVNSVQEHSFFDVKVKNQHLAYQVFTSDLPPVPVGKNDTLRVLFQVESNSGSGNQRIAICEGTFSGNLLEGTDHQQGNVVSVESDSAEWHFIKQNSADSNAWLLCFVCLRVHASALKKYLPYINRDST